MLTSSWLSNLRKMLSRSEQRRLRRPNAVACEALEDRTLLSVSTPVISGISDDTGASALDGVTNDPTLLIHGVSDADNTITVQEATLGVLGNTVADGSGNWTFDYTGTVLAEGSYNFQAQASDGIDTSPFSNPFGGNVAVDTTAPPTPVIDAISDDTGSAADDGVTSDATLILTGTAQANATVTVSEAGLGTLGTTNADPSGNWSFDYSGTSLSDGDYSFTATAKDVAGNESAPTAAFDVTVDSAVAPPVISGITDDNGVSAGDGITNDQTLLIHGTAEPHSTVTLSEPSLGSPIGSVAADENGDWSYDLTGTVLGAGNYSFSATQTDLAGNTSGVSTSFDVTIDTTSPATPAITGFSDDTGSASNDGITNDATLTIFGTADPDTIITISDATLGELGQTISNGGGNWTFDYTGTTLPDGNYSFTATASDVAGNTSSASAALIVTVDTTAPSAPVMTGILDDTGVSGSDGVTSDQTLTIMGTAEPNAAVDVSEQTAGLLGAVFANGSGIWSYDYTGTTLAEGTYFFTAQATDAAGNTGNASPAFAGKVTVDMTNPAAPTIAGITNDTGDSSSDGITNDATLVVYGTTEVNATITVSEDTLGLLGTTVADGSGNWSFDYSGTALADGDYHFTATATDLAGNTGGSSAFDATVDTVVNDPVITSVTDDTGDSNSDGITTDQTLIISGTVEPNSMVAVSEPTLGSLGIVAADGSGNWSLDYTGTTLSEGNYSFSAVAQDVAGNTSGVSTAFAATIDLTVAAPVLTGISDDTGDSNTDLLTSDDTLFINGTAEAGSTVTVSEATAGVLGTAAADGSGNWSYDHTGTMLADGAYSFSATTTDVAGNVSGQSAALDVTIDSFAPAKPVITGVADDSGESGSDGITNDQTLTVSGTAEPDSTVTVSEVTLGQLGQTTADGSGDWTFDYTGSTLAEGAYSFTATATDAAGNTGSASDAYVVTVDLTADVPSVTNVTDDTGDSNSDGITNDATLMIVGTAEANSTVTVSEPTLGDLGTTTADGSGDWTFDYTGSALTDGDYSFTASYVDVAGNASEQSDALDVTVDTSTATPVLTGIAGDTGQSSTDETTSDDTLVISGTAEPNSTVTVSEATAGVLGNTTADANGDWSYDYTGVSLADDDYSFTATATDVAGNTSATSAALDVTVDSTAPAAPAVTGVTDDAGSSAGDQITNDQTLIISGTAEADSTVAVSENTLGLLGTATTDGGGNWSFDYTSVVLSEGDYSFTAAATDVAGNTGSTSSALDVTIDLTVAAPSITGITDDTGDSNSDGVTNDATLMISGTAEANGTVTVSEATLGELGTANVDGVGNWTFDYTGTILGDADYSFTAVAEDVAGNVSEASVAFDATVDTTAPAAPTVDSISDDTGTSDSDGVTSDTALTISGTAEPDSTVTVSEATIGVLGTTTADSSGDWSFDYTGTSLADDDYEFTATATDAAGNTGPASTALDVTVDTTAPAAPVVTGLTADTGSSGTDGITNDTNLFVEGTAEPNSTVTVSEATFGVLGTTMADGGGNWSFDYTATTLPDGDYSFTATATDAAGNTGAASTAFDATVDTVAETPTITGITDDTATGGDGITADPTLIISGTAEPNSTVEVSEATAGVLGTTPADGSGDWSFDHTGTILADGDYQFSATMTDLAGNTSAVDTIDVTVDTAAPAAPAITGIADDTGSSGSDNHTGDPTLIFSGTAEADATVTLSDPTLGTLGSTTADGGGDWTFDYTGTPIADGDYTITATATDAAGNTSAASPALNLTVDATAPAVSINGAPSSSPEATAINLTSTITEPHVDTIDWLVTNSGGSVATGNGTTLDFTPADNDTYTVSLTVTDVAGNVSNDTVMIDVTNVAPTIVSPVISSGSIDEGDTITLSGSIAEPSADDSFTLDVDWGDGTMSSVPLPAGSTAFNLDHTYTDDDPTSTTSDFNNISITLTDDDNGEDTAAPSPTGVTVFNVAPSLSGLAASTADEGSETHLTGTIADPGVDDTFTLEVMWGDGNVTMHPLPAGTTSFDVTHIYVDDNPTGTASDNYTVSATLSDDDGGTDTGATTARVDNVAPTVVIDGMPTEGLLEQQINLTSTVTDPGTADVISYSWVVMKDAMVVATSSTDTISFTPMETGDYEVTLDVGDDDTGSGQAMTTITVEVADVDFDSGTGALTIVGSLGESIGVSSSGGNVVVTINGMPDTTIGTVASADVTSISVTGGTGDNDIDLASVGATDFPNLTGVSIDGADGNDTIVGTMLADQIVDLSGDNVLNGKAGNDTLTAGAGNDTLRGGSGRDWLEGGAGDDELMGQGGHQDTLLGGPGADVLEGGVGSDSLAGGDDNDLLDGGPDDGDDTLAGDGGNDTLTAGAGDDHLTGGDGDDFVNGNAGNDTIVGGAGNDQLFGGAGHDMLEGGTGDDTFRGGGGNDLLFEAADTDFTLTDMALVGLGTDDLNDMETARLFGGAGNNTLDSTGFSGNVTLNGKAGNDTLRAGAGHDKLSGGGGDDFLIGGDGNDLLRGQNGGDVLQGGLGDDTLDGQDGTFGNDLLDGGPGMNVLLDD